MPDPTPKFDLPVSEPAEEEELSPEEKARLQAEAERREGVPIEFVYRSMRETPETEKNIYEYARFEDDLGIILSGEQKRAFESFPREWAEALNQDDPHEPGKKQKETYGVFPILDKVRVSIELEPYVQKLGLPNEFPLSLQNMHKLLEARRAQLGDELKKAGEEKAKDREEEVQEKMKRLPKFFSGSAGWFMNESQEFAEDAPKAPRWGMVRKEPLPKSTPKDFPHQLALLAKISKTEVEARITRPLREIRERWQRQEISLAVRRSQEEAFLAELLKESDYEIPVGREEAEQKILYHLKTGERLNENVWARCRNLVSSGARVDVGGFGSGGLYVGSDWEDDAYSNVGLSVARKFQK